jgi:single-strand DNA-binding protein
MSDNTVVLAGNLAAASELRFTSNRTQVANFGLAITHRVREGGDWRDRQTSFFRVTAWRDLKVNVAESLDKGDRVVVVGRLRARSFETPEGERRSVVEVGADDVVRACGGRSPGPCGSANRRQPPSAHPSGRPSQCKHCSC